MRSTSSDGVVARDLPDSSVRTSREPAELRRGAWTRLGSDAVVGDTVTETILGGIAERSHQAARAQGYAIGWAEGRRVALARAEEEAAAVRRTAADGRARREAEHRQAMAALDAAVEQVRLRMAEAVDAVAAHAVEVALELTRAILAREVLTATDPGADALRRAIASVEPHVTATVRLHPEDRAALDPAVVKAHDVVVVDDPSLSRGDAVAETDDTLVDATIAAALERVREVLTR